MNRFIYRTPFSSVIWDLKADWSVYLEFSRHSLTIPPAEPMFFDALIYRKHAELAPMK